ncbi:hypothetical protein ACRS8P_14385 [Burkholderia cenocepacia]
MLLPFESPTEQNRARGGRGTSPLPLFDNPEQFQCFVVEIDRFSANSIQSGPGRQSRRHPIARRQTMTRR